ncbi:DNA internalization-related competence protein ComEC/Rec2 [Eoetvoesiella caeni]
MTGRVSILAFLLASGVVQGLPGLPRTQALGFAMAVLAVLSLALVLARPGGLRVLSWRWLVPLWAAWLGLAYTVAMAQQRLADELTEDNQNKVARVVLQVAGLVRLGADSRMFEADVISSRPAGVPSRIQVSWGAPGHSGPYGRFNAPAFDFPKLAPGQVWRMTLTLKRPHGARNLHGFDYEGYLFAQGIRATGSVRGTPVLLEDRPWASLPIAAQRMRHRVRAAASPFLEGMRYGPVLLALSIGDQAAIDTADWQVFNRAGLSHLIAISGGHITMIAAVGGLTAFWLWRRARWNRRMLAEYIPAQIVAALAALAVAWLYCLLAGWGVPARRTFLMLAVLALAHIFRMRLTASRVLCPAALAVVLLDPWAMLASGFWLSFGAVWVLMASGAWWGRQMRKAGRSRLRAAWLFIVSATALQLAITVALLPLLALLFNEVSLISPLANAYAIPLVTLLVTPLSLLLALLAFIPGLEFAAAWAAWLGHAVLEALMHPTVWLTRLELASVNVAAAPAWMSLAAVLGLLAAILPYGLPMRHAAWLLMLPALFWRPERPSAGGWNLHALDVGQAASFVVQTANHVLVFDTGLRSGPQSDAGARIVWPFLRAQGENNIDVLVVSHADIDHAGGVRSLLAAAPVQQSYSSFDLQAHLKREAGLLGLPGQLPSLPLAMTACEYGAAWQVDGVAFEFLWPLRTEPNKARKGKSRKSNDRSCVLRIRGRHHSILLTGDIAAAQERALLDRGLAGVDVVAVAHHGSLGSSAVQFVNGVQAGHAIAQAGAWNRYGHPHPKVQRRWEDAGAQFWRTDRDGAVQVQSRSRGLVAQSVRHMRKRYWQGR